MKVNIKLKTLKEPVLYSNISITGIHSTGTGEYAHVALVLNIDEYFKWKEKLQSILTRFVDPSPNGQSGLIYFDPKKIIYFKVSY